MIIIYLFPAAFDDSISTRVKMRRKLLIDCFLKIEIKPTILAEFDKKEKIKPQINCLKTPYRKQLTNLKTQETHI